QLALDESLYVAAAHRCLAIHPQTGKTEREYTLPVWPGDPKLEWGYLARVGDLLLGSGVKAGSIRRTQTHIATVTETHWDFAPVGCSDVLFAWKTTEDKPAWTYQPGGPPLNQTLTIGNGWVYCVESADPETRTAG